MRSLGVPFCRVCERRIKFVLEPWVHQLGLVVNGFGYTAGGWRVEKHPRFVTDTTGDGRADIVGFGDDGVYVARAQSGGTFAAANFVVNGFGYTAGSWRVEKHPRFVASTTGDGLADIVGYGDDGVSRRTGPSGGHVRRAPQKVIAGSFGYNVGWRIDRHRAIARRHYR